MKAGDVVIVPFPFSDLSSGKVRPALIVSGKDFNKSRNFLLVAISTKPGIKELSVPLSQQNLSVGELQKSSFIRLQNIFTLEKRMVIKKVGVLNNDFYQKIREKLVGILG